MTVFGIGARELYDAVLTRDRRFDGRMFVGVRSTRIYCRPICTVRPPRFENCSFYRQAATAEAAGFRPCLRCRPELAPGSTAPVDAVSRLAALAIRRIEDGALSELNLDELAAEFGITARHLRRAVRQEAGLTPVELAQTQRLLLAKQLLTDTKMTVTEAAFAAGFESLRRFNAAFKQRYRLTPTSLRRSAGATKVEMDDAYSFNLDVRPPFDLAPLLAFWETRATPGVEQVTDGWYRRTAVVGDRTGWAAVGPGRKDHTVQVLVSTGLGPVLPSVLCRLKAMLDVRAEPVGVAERLSEDPLLASLFERWPGPRIPGTFDGFECGIRTILGQQISVRAATTLAGRLASRFGQASSTPYGDLTTAFPSPDTLAAAGLADLQSLGLTARRAETVKSFATAVADGKVRLDPGADPDRVRAALVDLPGVGEWTVEYLLLRAVGWPDAFPASDLGLVKASGLSPAELRARADRWRPWRGYAAVLLWQSLGGPNGRRLHGGNR
ncbi:MAG TPA: DNA-3-methyladenine glycosylase 2 family protein [Pirellulales bacterium]|nr:DNA-3-methyladenine glycosylase 2 family protein [Pirellulales bacterium]